MPAATMPRRLRKRDGQPQPRQSTVVRAACARRRSRARRTRYRRYHDRRSTTTSRPCRFPIAGESSTRSAIRIGGSTRTTATYSRPTNRYTATGSSTLASFPTPSSRCATYRRPSASVRPNRAGEDRRVRRQRPARRDSEPRVRVRVLRRRHRLQTAGVRVPIHAGLQRELRRSSTKSSASTSILATARTRADDFVGIQAAFVDKHLRNVSDRYDFDSIRVGIQPFSSDFRGFLFQDNQLGVRLFGNRRNNVDAVQPGVVPPHREGHEQRSQRPRPGAARRRHLHRQSVLAGPAGARVHVAGSARVQPQPRRRRHPLRSERLHRAARRRSA